MIHQIWSDVYEPLPKIFQELGDTWKYFHKDWQYVLWDDEKIEQFVNRYFPLYAKPFNSFAYNVQRWDVIRYLILYKMGGLYVDFDYECIDPVEKVLLGNCCFALEPEEHRLPFLDPNHPYFNNAFMAAIPGHPFMKRVINDVFRKIYHLYQRTRHVLNMCYVRQGQVCYQMFMQAIRAKKIYT